MRPDVSGRADDQIAAVFGQFGRRGRRRDPLLQTRNPTQTGPVDDLVLVVVGLGLVHDVAGGQTIRHRLVDIDHAAPEFGMLQRQRAAQAPQHRLRRDGAVAVADRLGVSGEQVKLWRHAYFSDGRGQPARGVEQFVAVFEIELAAAHLRRVEHVGHPGQRIGDRLRVGSLGQQ